MTEESPSRGSMPAGEKTRIDWAAAAQSPEFQELVSRRRRFVVPATVFFLSWYLGFVALAGYAPDFMGESVYEGLTVGYVLAMSQFVMVWGLGWLYLRKADRVFDPLAEQTAQAALERGRRVPGGQFPRPGVAPEHAREEVTRR